MKATSFVLVVLATALFAGCAEEKPAKPADSTKPAAATPSANAAPAAAPDKPAADKKDEGGW